MVRVCGVCGSTENMHTITRCKKCYRKEYVEKNKEKTRNYRNEYNRLYVNKNKPKYLGPCIICNREGETIVKMMCHGCYDRIRKTTLRFNLDKVKFMDGLASEQERDTCMEFLEAAKGRHAEVTKRKGGDDSKSQPLCGRVSTPNSVKLGDEFYNFLARMSAKYGVKNGK